MKQVPQGGRVQHFTELSPCTKSKAEYYFNSFFVQYVGADWDDNIFNTQDKAWTSTQVFIFVSLTQRTPVVLCPCSVLVVMSFNLASWKTNLGIFTSNTMVFKREPLPVSNLLIERMIQVIRTLQEKQLQVRKHKGNKSNSNSQNFKLETDQRFWWAAVWSCGTGVQPTWQERLN